MLRPARLARRRLTIERLESREVPASLVEVVDIPVNALAGEYDVIESAGNTLLVAGGDGISGKLLRLNDRGQLVEKIELAPAAGLLNVAVHDLSEDGCWAVGHSFTIGVHQAGDPLPPVLLTLWRLSDPRSPIVLDFVAADQLNLKSVRDVSDDGTFTVESRDGRLLVIGAAGVAELDLPDGTPREWLVRFNRLAAASRSGGLVVGATLFPPALGDEVPRFRATVWRSGVPEFLEVAPATITSAAAAVSDDGRLVGGSLHTETLGHAACVWVEGQLQVLRTKTGQPVQGQVQFIVSNIGGDPRKWLAFGQAYSMPGFADANFVASSDGAALPLGEWLRTAYGFGGEYAIGNSHLRDVLHSGGVLRIFTQDAGWQPGGPVADPVVAAPYEIVGSRARMITVSLNGNPIGAPTPDVDGNGLVGVLDVLAVVNAITLHGSGTASASLPAELARADVDHNGILSLLDLLAVVNYLTLQHAAVETGTMLSGEAEGEAPSDGNEEPNVAALVIDQICRDLAARRRRR